MKIELIIPDDYADCLSVTAIGNRSGQLKVMSRSFQIRNRDKQTFRLATNEDRATAFTFYRYIATF